MDCAPGTAVLCLAMLVASWVLLDHREELVLVVIHVKLLPTMCWMDGEYVGCACYAAVHDVRRPLRDCGSSVVMFAWQMKPLVDADWVLDTAHSGLVYAE